MNDEDNKLMTAREAIAYLRAIDSERPTLQEVELENAKYIEEQREEKRRQVEAKRRRLEADRLRESLGTENRNATILRWVKEGKRQNIIAREFKISAGRVGQICRQQAEREARNEEQARGRETFRALTKGVRQRQTLRNLRIITEALKGRAEMMREWQARRKQRRSVKK